MARWLKYNTQQRILLGPIIDDTDFKSLETGATFDQAGVACTVIKQDGTHVHVTPQATGAGDWYWLYSEGGIYELTLKATDCDVLGQLKVNWKATGMLPVCEVFMVVPIVNYDALVLGTDNLDINVAQWLGTAAHASTENGTPCVELIRIDGHNVAAHVVEGVLPVDVEYALGHALVAHAVEGAIVSTVETTTGIPAIAAAVWNALTATYVTASTFGLFVQNLAATVWDKLTASHTVTASFGKLIGTNLDAAISSLPQMADLASAGEVADEVWDDTLADHDAAGSTGLALASSVAAPTAAENAAELLDTLISGHTTTGTVGENLSNIDQSITDLIAAIAGTGDTDLTAILAAINTFFADGYTYHTTYEYGPVEDTVGTAIQGAKVLASDAADMSTHIKQATTDASGNCTFYLGYETGGTLWYFWTEKAGYSFPNPDDETVGS